MVPFGGKVWEVDEFLDENEGLIVAEIELSSEDAEFEKPLWVAEEVTGIEKYYNSNLSSHPFKQWT
jgi:CYTH domain-containing protein